MSSSSHHARTFLQRVLVRQHGTTARRGHAEFYGSLLPAMIPVALLGSAVYMGLNLVQARLAHEKFLDEARQRIHTLEQQLDALQHRPSN